jgi:hypothetical protein
MANDKLLNDEDFREDCRQAGKEDIHPRLKPDSGWRKQRCRACGTLLDLDELTEDVLCCECDKIVKELEEGKI